MNRGGKSTGWDSRVGLRCEPDLRRPTHGRWWLNLLLGVGYAIGLFILGVAVLLGACLLVDALKTLLGGML